MEEESMEYTVFTTTDKDGQEVEMAVLDEFEVDHKNYAAAALVEGDTISEDGIYIYRIKINQDEATFEKITDPREYDTVSKAYIELE